jgi:hypothetical protein
MNRKLCLALVITLTVALIPAGCGKKSDTHCDRTCYGGQYFTGNY